MTSQCTQHLQVVCLFLKCVVYINRHQLVSSAFVLVGILINTCFSFTQVRQCFVNAENARHGHNSGLAGGFQNGATTTDSPNVFFDNQSANGIGNGTSPLSTGKGVDRTTKASPPMLHQFLGYFHNIHQLMGAELPLGLQLILSTALREGGEKNGFAP